MSRTKGELLKMLQFLDSADVEDDRVECAIQLALDPSIRRRKRVSAVEVFRNRTSLACQVWQGFTDHAHSRLLLNTLGYDNYAVDIAGCPDQPAQPRSGCRVDLESVKSPKSESCSVLPIPRH